MNYHEMTMNEPRDSPAKRKQFLVICTVIAGFFLHAVLTAGVLMPLNIEDGIFPGGDFVYKFTKRDYAASMSMQESIGKDIGWKPKEFADKLYTIYLDDPNRMGGRRQRFAAGFLAMDKEGKKIKEKLLGKNAEIKPPTAEDIVELPAFKLWPRLKYETTTLPSVNCAYVNFPFTNGFVSALIHSWKVIPSLRKHAQEHVKKDSPVTVVTTCSIEDGVCTHYAPLYQGRKFLLGQPDMETYLEQLGPEPMLNWSGMKNTLKKMLPPLKYVID